MQPRTPTRFIDPALLAGISHLDRVAKTVVDGFVAGLHRSPDFGFSQEFAEYRSYTPGDDLRHVDWNVFARTERAYLKRYRGETNQNRNPCECGARTPACRVHTRVNALAENLMQPGNQIRWIERRSHECERGTQECVRHD